MLKGTGNLHKALVKYIMAIEAVRKGLWWLPNVQWHYWVVAGARCEDHKEIQGQRE